MFCAVPKSQAVIWDVQRWKNEIYSWLANREMGYIRGYMSCLTKRNNLCRAVDTAKRYRFLWWLTGEFSYKKLRDELDCIWGLDEEIEQSFIISKNPCEPLENLENMEKAYYSVADDLRL